jgi:pSer/pThr/pTyr-binding forkhead associated (FHA) protein
MVGTVDQVPVKSAPRDGADQGTAAYTVPPFRGHNTAPAPRTPLPGTATLTITKGPGARAPVEIPLGTGTTVIGRYPDCDIVLQDVTVSRRHAEVRRTGDTFTVADLGSLNGTYVNRTPIDHVSLADGDVVLIGTFQLVFRSSPTAAGGQSR